MAVWGLVHVRYLVGWGDRLVTVVRWAWAWLARNRGERVIDVATADVDPGPRAPDEPARADGAARAMVRS